MWSLVHDRLLFELELARIIPTAFDAHGAIMVTVDFTNYDVVYGSGHLAPLKCLTIFKLKSKDTNGI